MYKKYEVPSIGQCNYYDRDDLVICTTHFNPCKFIKLKNTFYEWCKWLGENTNHLKTYELVYDNEKPELLGSKVIRGTSDKHIMFQKEALINRCLRDCPSHIKYFAWIDHDFIIKDKDWIEKSIEKIKGNVKCVQLFKETHYLGPRGGYIFSVPGRMSTLTKGNPGGAWIGCVDFLNEIGGLLDRNVVGGGDQYFICSVLHDFNFHKQGHKIIREYTHDYINYVRSKGYIGSFLDTDSFHLFHGQMPNRQYSSRGSILVQNNYKPFEDTIINLDGILEWSSDKPELHRLVREYFINRKEDE